MRRWYAVGGVGAVVVAGCFENQPNVLAPGPFERPDYGRSAKFVNAPVGSTESAARVDALGRQILAANPHIGAKPLFHTIGVPECELFHRGTSDVWITEGLVRKCSTEAQLAAVLSTELARMVSEHEATVPTQARLPQRLPPMAPYDGRDGVGAAYPADMTRMAELARFEQDRKQQAHPPAPPEPAALARTYLVAAGFRSTDLDDVKSILSATEKEGALERQMAPTGESVQAGTVQLGPPTAAPLPTPSTAPPAGGTGK